VLNMGPESELGVPLLPLIHPGKAHRDPPSSAWPEQTGSHCRIVFCTVMVGTEPNSTRLNEMKKLLAAIAPLCLSSTGLAHDIYSNLRDRNGHLCCNDQDCKPVQATLLPDGNYYLPASDEIIPADMAAPSPDDRFHHCTNYPIATELFPWGGPIYESEPKTRYFFAPMNAS
jgi:hypothetical protein